jgi:glutamine cyclotransferase
MGAMTLFAGKGAEIGARFVVLWGLCASSAYSQGVKENTLTLVRAIPHSGYSEGLDYSQGFLWNALPKAILKIDPKDGSVVSRFVPATEYSESLVWVAGMLWNVSFSDNGLYRGSLEAGKMVFSKAGTVPEVHAWGLEHDGKHLVVTGNYSSKLYFLNPRTGKLERTLETQGKDLEDLAWDGTGFWSSSFTTHRGKIFRIDPKTGSVGPLYALPDKENCPIIDGIAYDGKHLWITGKECPQIYCVTTPR